MPSCGMHTKSKIVCAGTFYLFALIRVVAAAPPPDRCEYPPGLHDEISKKYPGTHLVGLADLEEYDRKLYRKDHGTRCPGLVRVNFYGDGKPTYALVLIAGENPKRRAQLVVAHQVGNDREIRSLETTDGTPVVWRQGPGKYDGMYEEEQQILARNPVIVFCGYGSWAILYAWTGAEVKKIWLSD
ncbi:MAG: hypothetical protein AUH11_15710 [Acidobacteria bacterium 13_2_20CM_57_17]|nr:MAG: hypothetical protein AUH11_15710 [Acidobacteria bacterium 13_2_20CM_57_17]OLB96003.1 MAG: hypothetical protein AUI02_02830 [Acidobacteria bacterium 13_2_20CM_2_57_12]